MVASWLEWLSGLSSGLWTKGSLVQFPVRAHAWVVGQVLSRGLVRGNHTLGKQNRWWLASWDVPSGTLICSMVRTWSLQPTATWAGSEREILLYSSYKMTIALADTLIAPLWETLTKGTWLSHTWIPDPQKLRNNKCLLFHNTQFWSNLLHNNTYLISLCNPP